MIKKLLFASIAQLPPHRIQFSLAHEISHIIFDSDIDVSVDSFIPNFYWKKWITRNESPEYFAYKFAQFFLIPFEQIYPIANAWPNVNLALAQKLVENGITTKEVLANAIHDSLLLLPPSKQTEEMEYYTPTSDQFQRMDWEEGIDDHSFGTDPKGPNFQSIKNAVSAVRASSKSNLVYEYLGECTQYLNVILDKEKDNISEEILQDIEGFLGIGNK